MLVLPVIFQIAIFVTQESVADAVNEAWNRRQKSKICDEPTCWARKRDVSLYKCRRCQVATYCCHEHSVKHWPVHMSLCKELQRKCVHSGCEKRAQEVKCRTCDVATYCSGQHRSAYKSRYKELREYLWVFIKCGTFANTRESVELQRRCNDPECEKRVHGVKCLTCDVAAYCRRSTDQRTIWRTRAGARSCASTCGRR